MKGLEMNYSLSFNNSGAFDGFQWVEWELNHQQLHEFQQYSAGLFIGGAVKVWGVGSSKYMFNVENWGTMELTRNAAEMFAADELFNVIIVPIAENIYSVRPVTEESFIFQNA